MNPVYITDLEMSAVPNKQEWKLTIRRGGANYGTMPCELPYDVKMALMDWLKGNGQDHMS